jgi:hypothetical protein
VQPSDEGIADIEGKGEGCRDRTDCAQTGCQGRTWLIRGVYAIAREHRGILHGHEESIMAGHQRVERGVAGLVHHA